MARIPLGDFGNVVARPSPQVGVDPDAYGAGIGRALERAGRAGMQMADRQGQEEDQRTRELDAHKRAAAQEQTAEVRAAQRQAAAEARAAAAEARRVKAITAQARVANGLSELGDEIERGLADGSIDKTKVPEIYAARSARLVEDGIKDVAPEHQEIVRAQLLNDLGRGQQAVRKLVGQRERQDILAGGLSYLEEMQRFAARGVKEADQAIANVRAFWTATGPQAGETPAQASARVQQFAERVRYTQATALVNADPAAALKALRDQNYLPELDPGQRTSLIHTADARVLQQQQRAEIHAQARQRMLEQEWNGFSTVIEAGKIPTPQETARLDKLFRGTPMYASFQQLVAAGPAAAAFASQPLAVQAASLDAMQTRMNTGGATPDMLEQFQRADKAHKAALADVKADPYAAAAERGVLRTVSPLSLDMATLPQQLVQRAADAAVVSQWAGQDVSLFRPQEAAKVGEMLAAMPAKDRANSLAGLATVMSGGQMRAFGQQLGAKDFGLAAAAMLASRERMTTADRPAAEILLTGLDAVKEQRIKWPAGQDQAAVRQEIDQITRGAFASEDANRMAGDAALAIYAGLLAEGRNPTAKMAVDLATGGIMESGGGKIVKPYGWTDGMVRKALRDFDAERVGVLTGGQPIRWGDKQLTPAEAARLIPGAQLHPSKVPDSYVLSVAGRPLADPAGRPILFPMERR